MPRRKADARPFAGPSAPTVAVPDRRAHRAAAGAGAQGQAGHALPGAGRRLPFGLCAPGVNAIEYAARLIGKLGEISTRLAQPQHHDRRFDPPFTTLQTGIIRGGRALNIVPQDCQFDFEVRTLPGFDPQQVVDELQDYAQQQLLPGMRAVQADTAIDLQPLSAYPGLATAPDSEAAELLALLSGSRNSAPWLSAPRADCSMRPASPRWSAGRAAWTRGTSRMSSSAWSSSRPAMRYCCAWRTGWRNRPESTSSTDPGTAPRSLLLQTLAVVREGSATGCRGSSGYRVFHGTGAYF